MFLYKAELTLFKQMKYIRSFIIKTTLQICDDYTVTIDTAMNHKSPRNYFLVGIYVPQLIRCVNIVMSSTNFICSHYRPSNWVNFARVSLTWYLCIQMPRLLRALTAVWGQSKNIFNFVMKCIVSDVGKRTGYVKFYSSPVERTVTNSETFGNCPPIHSGFPELLNLLLCNAICWSFSSASRTL